MAQSAEPSWFASHRDEVRVSWPISDDGLRRAQVGATWALAAHFTTSSEPAIAVLPTGAGKTAVMTLLPLLIPTTRVLVVAPSRVVRDQLTDAFASLSDLRRAEALPADGDPPRVRRIDGRRTTADDWQEVTVNTDVAIGTVHCLSPGMKGVAECPEGLFDLVLVDEAHHAAAQTWRRMIEAFSHARIALFTATPFRRDRRELPADVIYNYRLRSALADRVLTPVTFHPVAAVPGSDHDQALIDAVKLRLQAPEHATARSLVLVRADRLEDAKALQSRYAGAGIPLGYVDHQSSSKHVRDVIRECEDGDLKGVVSVGVLGEGFNLPALKIAAYHRPHRSLPATLQFVGRISRTGRDLGPAELVAIAEDVENETKALYKADSDWAVMIPQLADAAVDIEHDRREYLRNFADPDTLLSLAAIRAKCQVQIYRLNEAQATTQFDMTRQIERFAGGDVIYSSPDGPGRLRLLVTEHLARPPWIESDALDAPTYQLHLAVWSPTTHLLYVQSETDLQCTLLVNALGVEDPARAGPGLMGRLMHQFNPIEYFSIGMRATRAPGGLLPTYQTKAGSTVGASVVPSEAVSFTAGHLIARIEDPFNDSGHVTAAGVSVARSKVWTPQVLDLLTFRRWCDTLDGFALNDDPEQPNAPGLPLRMPSELTRFPDVPIAAVLPPSLLTGPWMLDTPTGPRPLFAADLLVARLDDFNLDLTIAIDDLELVTFRLNVLGTIECAEPPRILRANSTAEGSLLELLQEWPPYVYFADGSSTRGDALFRPPDDLPPVPDSCLVAIDWGGANPRKEAGREVDGKLTVQGAMEQYYATERPDCLIVNDDGKGEIADLVVIDLPQALLTFLAQPANAVAVHEGVAALERGEFIRVTLCHCKFAGGDAPRLDLRDLDQLVGQTSRSMKWTAPGRLWSELAVRTAAGGRATVWKGDAQCVRALFEAFAERPPPTRFSVHLAQPGTRVADLNLWEGGRNLVSGALAWATQHDVSFSLIGSGNTYTAS